MVADALRPEDASGYYPGEAVLRMADVVVVNKVNAATATGVGRAIEAVRRVNAGAPLVRGALLGPGKPIVRARYEFEDVDEPGLAAHVDRWLEGING